MPKFESLAVELEALVGRKVDLVTRRGLKPWVHPHVLRDARVKLEWQILWESAVGDIPALRRQILNILTTEFSDSESA